MCRLVQVNIGCTSRILVRKLLYKLSISSWVELTMLEPEWPTLIYTCTFYMYAMNKSCFCLFVWTKFIFPVYFTGQVASTCDVVKSCVWQDAIIMAKWNPTKGNNPIIKFFFAKGTIFLSSLFHKILIYNLFASWSYHMIIKWRLCIFGDIWWS